MSELLATRSTPINVAGADQPVLSSCIGVHVTTAGNIVGQLKGDTADRTFVVLAGTRYPYVFKIIKQATTATGVLLFDESIEASLF